MSFLTWNRGAFGLLPNLFRGAVFMSIVAFSVCLTAAPVITSADHLVLPEGETITLTGTGLGTANAARMLWTRYDIPVTVSLVNDSTLEVVMPDVPQDIREHLLLVETPTGSTVAVPANFFDHTSNVGIFSFSRR